MLATNPNENIQPKILQGQKNVDELALAHNRGRLLQMKQRQSDRESAATGWLPGSPQLSEWWAQLALIREDSSPPLGMVALSSSVSLAQ